MLTSKLLKLLSIGIILFSLNSCGSDEPQSPTAPDDETKTGEITQNETWSADRIYKLQGKVIVNDGITLTIQPGTIIKGMEGEEANASALIVARGGKIMAEGTAEKPIVFTSILDNIEVGQKSGTNLDETDAKKWGGLIVLGKAKVSDKNGDTTGHIEGIPADQAYGIYGGNDDTDNSGVIKYVSIRHGGQLIGDGNEINGLSLGGVGSGTTIKNIEIVANLDDGIECFGGTVSIDHALVAYQQDDAFDIDQNFAGEFINSMVVYKSSIGDEFLEIDGPEASTNVNGKFTVKNCLFIDKDNNGSCDLKSKAQGVVKDNEFNGLNKFKISAKFDDTCDFTNPLTDAYTHYMSGDLEIKMNKTDAILNIYTKSEDGAGTTCEFPVGFDTAAQAIFTGAGNSSTNAPSVVSQSDFDWTWTAQNNKF